VKTVAKDGRCLFRRFNPFVPFEVIQNVRLLINTTKDYKIHVVKSGDSVEITAISEIHKVPVNAYYISTDKITDLRAVVIRHNGKICNALAPKSEF
jgi:hypothetical protein